jgi:hypothetical protein
MIRRLVLLGREDGCYEMLLDDLIAVLKRFRIARYYVKSSVETWNARQIYFDESDYFFVIFPHLVEIPFPEKKYWVYFLENNTDGNICQLYNKEIVGSLLLHSIKSFDHNETNIAVWKTHIPDLSIQLLPPPIFSNFIQGGVIVKRYDVLFYGKLSERRKVILREIQSRFPTLKYCISDNMKGSRLNDALLQSKVALNLHQNEDITTLNQVKLHEMMRYNILIVNEMPQEYDDNVLSNYECCVKFVDHIRPDTSNISTLFDAVDDMVSKANSPKCNFNLGYRKLFLHHYPKIGF